MTDWFKEFKDIAYPPQSLKGSDMEFITKQDKYDRLIVGIVGDIKEALTHVLLDIFLHDLERRGIYLTSENTTLE